MRVEDDQPSNVVLSPDAKHVVFSGIDEGGQSALYLRALHSSEMQKVGRDRERRGPFFSPDGSWIAFFLGDRIMKVPVSGGPPVQVCDEIGSSRGAAWGYDDRIVFPRHFDSALWQVPGSGGTATPLTELDDARRERTHRWPHVVPGHPVVLFTVATKDSPEYYDDALIDALNLETGERKTVFEGASSAVYAPSGHLIFGRHGSLWAVPFDIDALEATGTPVPVQSNVMGLRNSGVVFASLAANGILAYIRGQPEDLQRETHWRYLNGPPRSFRRSRSAARCTCNSRRTARKSSTIRQARRPMTSGSTTSSGRTARASPSRATTGTRTGDPDGKFIYYTSTRDGIGRVFRKASDGTGDEELIWEVDGVTVGTQDISPNGRTLLMSYHGENKADLYTLALDDASAESRPLLNGPNEEDLARFSPDGRWLAYTTDEPGGFEVFVCPASGIGGRWQISSDGGVLPRWSRDGKQLFYRIGRQLFVVDVDAGADASAFLSSNPRLVFDDLERARLTSGYDVSLDGKAILIGEPLQDESPLDTITVLVNWLDEVERLVPAGR